MWLREPASPALAQEQKGFVGLAVQALSDELRALASSECATPTEACGARRQVCDRESPSAGPRKSPTPTSTAAVGSSAFCSVANSCFNSCARPCSKRMLPARAALGDTRRTHPILTHPCADLDGGAAHGWVRTIEGRQARVRRSIERTTKSVASPKTAYPRKPTKVSSCTALPSPSLLSWIRPCSSAASTTAIRISSR